MSSCPPTMPRRPISTRISRAETPYFFSARLANSKKMCIRDRSLVNRLKMPMDFEVTGFNNIVNYGSDRLRFATPVPAGCRIHARYRIKSVEQIKSGVQVIMEINIHGVGQDRPSVINDLVMLYM